MALPAAPTRRSQGIAAHLRRREVLKLLGIAAAGSLVGCGEPRPFRRKRVIVIGAGLAGLSCAYELKKVGHDVTVLEAQSRVGGRVYTVREPFTNGLWAEMGAMRIPNSHVFTLAYVNQFGIPLLEFDEPAAGTAVRPIYFVRGQRFGVPPPGAPWPLDFTPSEQLAGLDMVSAYFEPFGRSIGEPGRAGWPSADAVARFDGITMAEHLASLGASSDWAELFVSHSGTYTVAASMLQILWHEFSTINNGWTRTFTMQGGCDQLPNALAQELDGQLQLERPVLRLDHGPDAVTVTYQDGGAARTATAEYLVLAMSFPALRNIEIVPEFPPDKMRAINEIEYVPAARSAFQTTRRFWRDEVPPGIWVACTDTVAERLWDQSDRQDGEAGLLVSYVHDSATTLAQNPRGARLDLVRSAISQVFPSFNTEDAGIGFDMYWNEDPWTGGISPRFRPGQLSWAYPVMGRREGRVFFAGEHTSPFASWMNGALQSGLRSALAIHDEP